MKNWKILLIMLAVFSMMSCDAMLLGMMGDSYIIPQEDQQYLKQVFGDNFVDRYTSRIFLQDLDDQCIGRYDYITDVIFIDKQDAPQSILLYLVAHEMAHAWQKTILHMPFRPATNYCVYTPITSKLNMEQEAEVVGFFTQLKCDYSFTNGRQIMQRSDSTWMYAYMHDYMGFNCGN